MKKNFFPIVGYNAAEIFLIFELKYFHDNKFLSKMILTHESGAQEDQFDGKKEGQKTRGTIPLRESQLLTSRYPAQWLLGVDSGLKHLSSLHLGRRCARLQVRIQRRSFNVVFSH